MTDQTFAQRQAQATKDAREFANTLRIQKAGNGYIVKTIAGPMVFTAWKDAATFMGDYFARLKAEEIA